MTTTNFNDWLNGIDLSYYKTVYELYQVINDKEGMGSFDFQPAKGSSDRWILSEVGSTDSLLISGEKARLTLLGIIENNYCEGMGIEGFYGYHQAMERDD